jgi:sec-independent protein translocase protein TatA
MIGLSNLLMQIPTGFEWVFIIIIIVVVFFGVKKIPEIARSFGRAKTEYEKSKIEARRELEKVKRDTHGSNDDDGLPAKDREKLESIADTLGIDYTHKNNDELRIAIELELAKGNKKEEV